MAIAAAAIAVASSPGRQQHHLRPPPGHHRPGAPADDPHQPLSLVIVDLTHPQAFSHRASVEDQRLQGKPERGKPSLLRH
jgi:hypothetical protein